MTNGREWDKDQTIPTLLHYSYESYGSRSRNNFWSGVTIITPYFTVDIQLKSIISQGEIYHNSKAVICRVQ